jgi:hypothetical protein
MENCGPVVFRASSRSLKHNRSERDPVRDRLLVWKAGQNVANGRRTEHVEVVCRVLQDAHS